MVCVSRAKSPELVLDLVTGHTGQPLRVGVIGLGRLHADAADVSSAIGAATTGGCLPPIRWRQQRPRFSRDFGGQVHASAAQRLCADRRWSWFTLLRRISSTEHVLAAAAAGKHVLLGADGDHRPRDARGWWMRCSPLDAC